MQGLSLGVEGSELMCTLVIVAPSLVVGAWSMVFLFLDRMTLFIIILLYIHMLHYIQACEMKRMKLSSCPHVGGLCCSTDTIHVLLTQRLEQVYYTFKHFTEFVAIYSYFIHK